MPHMTPTPVRCAGTRLALAVFEACYRADAPTLAATAAALLLPDANATLDARCEALAGVRAGACRRVLCEELCSCGHIARVEDGISGHSFGHAFPHSCICRK